MRFLLAGLLFLAVLLPAFGGEKAEVGEELPGGLKLLSAEFGLVSTDADGEIQFSRVPVMPLVTGLKFGWRLRFETDRPSVFLREEFELPSKPQIWESSLSAPQFVISADGRTGITEIEAPLDEGELVSIWNVTDGDPAGPCEIRIFIDGHLATTFKFVAGQPENLLEKK